MIDGGKDRARLFKKALEVKKGGKDKLRNVYKRIMLHSSEESVRTRRGARVRRGGRGDGVFPPVTAVHNATVIRSLTTRPIQRDFTS